MKIKKLASILLTATLTLGLVACGGTSKPTGGNNNTEESESNKITIWAWDEAFNIVAANKAKEMYIKENPDAEVEVVTMAQDDIVAKLNTSLSSGSYEGLPNVVLIEDYRIQGYLTAYQDEFSDLSSIAKQSDFAEYKTGVNYIDGKLYGVPFDSGVAATFYRTDLIEEAGYTKADMENLTWEKYIEIGKAVKEKTGIAMCTIDPSELPLVRMMLQSTGSWLTDADGKVTIADNEALKQAMQIQKDLLDAGIIKQVSDWDQFVSAFNNEEVASVITGCWIVPSIKKVEAQSGKWAAAEFPKMSANSKSVNASSIGGSGWYVLKNVGNTDMATDFLAKTFASNVDLMNELAEDITLVSTLNKSAEAPNYQKADEFFGGQELFADFAKWTSEVPSVNYGMHTYAIEDIMTEAAQAIVGGADIDETLKTFQSQVESAVAQ